METPEEYENFLHQRNIPITMSNYEKTVYPKVHQLKMDKCEDVRHKVLTKLLDSISFKIDRVSREIGGLHIIKYTGYIPNWFATGDRYDLYVLFPESKPYFTDVSFKDIYKNAIICEIVRNEKDIVHIKNNLISQLSTSYI